MIENFSDLDWDLNHATIGCPETFQGDIVKENECLQECRALPCKQKLLSCHFWGIFSGYEESCLGVVCWICIFTHNALFGLNALLSSDPPCLQKSNEAE